MIPMPHSTPRLFAFTFLTILFSAKPAFARWPTLTDADLVRNSKTVTKIEPDATYVVEYENQIEVKSELGRKDIGTYSLQYNSRSGDLEVLEAYTRNGKEKFPVLDEYIEDKAISTSSEGFDQINRVTIAFPRVEIGSILYLRIRAKTREIEVPGFFGSSYDFGNETYENSSTVRIESALPLNVAINDPRKHLDVKQSTENGTYVVTMKLTSPIAELPVSEKDSFLRRGDRTWVIVSTGKTLSDMAAPMLKAYNDIIESPLPPSYQAIVDKVKTMKKGSDQINRVTSELSTQVRYMGDWRAVRGGYVPHPLETIAKLQFGDCKDFAVSIAAILRALGYEARAAWVHRGIQPLDLPPLPILGAFNHAITWVKLENRIFWIDGTNLASFAQGVPDDLVGRAALVIDPRAARLENIPVGKPSDAEFLRRYEITFDRNGDAVLDADIKVTGRAAMPLTGNELRVSKQVLDHHLVNSLAGEKLVQWSKVGNYDLTSRITKDFTIKAKMGVSNYAMKTTGGIAYLLESYGESLMNLETKDRVSGLFLSWPIRQKSTYTVKNINKVGNRNLNCQVKSPWFTVSRKVTQKGKDVIIDDEQSFSGPVLSLEDLKSKRFLGVQKELRDCFLQVAVLFNMPSGK
jgi:hypothetical protein